MIVEDYIRLNCKYLKDATKLLKKGDYVQASEKYWGAFAEMVKAVAAKRGVILAHHRSVGEYIDKLHNENPKLGLRDVYYAANSLHINFYEDNLTPEQVKDSAQKIERCMKDLRRLI